MKILITGATGLVGKKLVTKLLSLEHEVAILTRNVERAKKSLPNLEYFFWDPENKKIDKDCLVDVDIVVNLAGENIASGRWTQERKNKLTTSRINGTSLITDAITSSDSPPKKLINSSAIGIYGDTDDKDITTNSPLASDFLAKLCLDWEQAALKAKSPETRVHCLRTGIVLSSEGGALKKMLPPFLLGAGGILGNGKQYMSWIHIDDLVGQIIFLIENDTDNNVYNSVSPKPVTNQVFTKTLGHVLKRPTIFPVPGFVLKTLFGQMSMILLTGQKVYPNNFTKIGYKFLYPELEEALKNLLNR